MDETDSEQSKAYEQRLKAAIHYGVGKICQEAEAESEVEFTKQFTAVLAEATFKQCQKMATDLELFARHGKRSTINTDDIKLFVRKTPVLLEHIQEKIDVQLKANEAKKKNKKPRSKKSVTSESSNINEDSSSAL